MARLARKKAELLASRRISGTLIGAGVPGSRESASNFAAAASASSKVPTTRSSTAAPSFFQMASNRARLAASVLPAAFSQAAACVRAASTLAGSKAPNVAEGRLSAPSAGAAITTAAARDASR